MNPTTTAQSWVNPPQTSLNWQSASEKFPAIRAITAEVNSFNVTVKIICRVGLFAICTFGAIYGSMHCPTKAARIAMGTCYATIASIAAFSLIRLAINTCKTRERIAKDDADPKHPVLSRILEKQRDLLAPQLAAINQALAVPEAEG